MAIIPSNIENANDIILPQNIETEPTDGDSGYSDDDAGRLVIQDTDTAKAWLEQYYFTTRWLLADVLYQAPPTYKNWEGSSIPRSFYRPFTVATHVNAIKNKVMGGLFYEEPPFKLRQKEGADSNTVRAISSVIATQLDMAGFRQEIKLGIHSALLFGTAIWKWDYVTDQKVTWEFRRQTNPLEIKTPGGKNRPIKVPTDDSDKFVKVRVQKTIAYPSLQNVDIRHCYVSPSHRVPNIADAPYVVHEMDLTFRDLMKRKDETYIDVETNEEKKRYNLPSEAELKEWFTPPVDVAQPQGVESYQQNTNYVHHAMPRFQHSSSDPFGVPIRVLERWDKEKVITVICGDVSGGYVIRNEANPYGCIPFYSVNWWDISDAFWGIGLGVTLSSDQLLQAGIKNGIIDMVTLALNGPLLHARGANINTQQLRARLAGFIAADIPAGAHSIEAAIMPLPLPHFPSEALGLLQLSEADTEQTSGASEQLTLGSTPAKGRSSLGRTATGAGGIMAAAESRLAGFVEDLVRQVYQPWLWKMHELNAQFLPMSALRDMLNDDLGKAFKVDEEKFLNSTYDGTVDGFDVLAGSHIAVKQQIAQWMPIAIQYLLNPSLQQQLGLLNKYVDVDEVVHMLFDTSGSQSYYDVIKVMTPEMKQAKLANNPAVIKAQADSKAQDRKTADKKELIHEKGTVDMAKELAKKEADNFNQEQLQRAEGYLDRSTIESSGGQDAITGAPNTEEAGFGGNLPG